MIVVDISYSLIVVLTKKKIGSWEKKKTYVKHSLLNALAEHRISG
jgi:hypothetical protein